MLPMNVWTKVGFCNEALGTVFDFVDAKEQTPPTFQYVLFSLMKIVMNLLCLMIFLDVFECLQLHRSQKT